jgi:RsiW-degrading membrane proteinase PrsW (M82 family)
LGGGRIEPDPAEGQAAPVDRQPDEVEAIRDSIGAEPALPDYRDPEQWSRWVERKRRGCSMAGNIGVTLLAAVLGGPFAVAGALLQGHQGFSQYVYMVVFGPIVEELLKQSGMTYVLEKKPYRVFSAWQIVFAALVSGLVFSAIENFMYLYRFSGTFGDAEAARLAAFRWAVCTPLHVGCAAIASLGLVRVWRRQLQRGRRAELSAAFPCFAVAIGVHGLYNLSAVFFGQWF